MKHIKLVLAGAVVALAQQAIADWDCQGLKVFNDYTNQSAVVVWKGSGNNKFFKGKYTSSGNPLGKTTTVYDLVDADNFPAALEIVKTQTCTRVECPAEVKKVATLKYGSSTHVFNCSLL